MKAVVVPGHMSALSAEEAWSMLDTEKEAAEDLLLVAVQAAIDIGVRSHILVRNEMRCDIIG